MNLGIHRNPLKKQGCQRNYHCHHSLLQEAGGCGMPRWRYRHGFWKILLPRQKRKGQSSVRHLSSCGCPHCSFGTHRCLGNGLSCCSCSQQMSPAWPRRSDSEEAGIRKAQQERSHIGGSICCNVLLFICLKCRQLTAHGEFSHLTNWPKFWTV